MYINFRANISQLVNTTKKFDKRNLFEFQSATKCM